MEWIHRLVEVLDAYFGSVCELDLVFAFHKTAHIIDEMWCGGALVEVSIEKILSAVKEADRVEKEEKEEAIRAMTPTMNLY